MADKQQKITEEDLKRRYREDFEPEVYMKSLYEKPTDNNHTADYMKFIVSSLHRIFSIDLPEGGDSVLDLGCGPTIHNVISASDHCKTIVSADFVDRNRQAVEKWIRNERTFDWTYVFQTVASLERETDHTKLEARLRSRMEEEVIHCDVTMTNPIAPLKRTFDVIVTGCCFESIATDDETYSKVVANAANLLASNGHLIATGVFNVSYYQAGRAGSFYGFSLRKELVEEAMKEAGLEILLWLIHPRHPGFTYEGDFTDTYVVLAKKKSD